ncbi:MAG: MFS transporter [Pirellulaceae bacterium]
MLPIYADQFAVDKHGWQLGALMAIFSVMQLIFAPMWGSLSDRIGRRPVLLMGLFSSAIFYAIFGIATMSNSIVLLFASRIGAGIAGATVPTAQAYIADCTTVDKRARGMALIGIAFGMGFTFGPLLGLLAVKIGQGEPGPWPGWTASLLSLTAFTLGLFILPESLHKGSVSAKSHRPSLKGLRAVVSEPSVPWILLAIFVCVFSFASFETTLSLLLKGQEEVEKTPFHLDWDGLLWTFAFIGFSVAIVQGGIVRPLAKRVPESVLATSGAVIEIGGFSLVAYAINQASLTQLYFALLIVVTGFSMMQPSLNSLLSRRTSPERQGTILGVGQSANAFARIMGAGLGIPMLKSSILLPYATAAVLMAVAACLVWLAASRGKDYGSDSASTKDDPQEAASAD